MIEANWPAELLASFSPGKLLWIHQQHQAREIKAEIRSLITLTAAVNTGTNGGEASANRLEHLKNELHRRCKPGDTMKSEPQSQTPLSAEQFAEWCRSETPDMRT